MRKIIYNTKYITLFFAIFILATGVFNQIAFAKHKPTHHRKVKYIVVERGIVDMRLPIIEVTDGDTIRTALSLPGPLDDIYIRLRNIDTPESRLAKCARDGLPCPNTTKAARCMKEYQLGLAASDYLKNFVGDSGMMVVRNYKWDKYGKRIDGDVFINDVNIGDMLIQQGYAKRYIDGKGQKPDWCE